ATVRSVRDVIDSNRLGWGRELTPVVTIYAPVRRPITTSVSTTSTNVRSVYDNFIPSVASWKGSSADRSGIYRDPRSSRSSIVFLHRSRLVLALGRPQRDTSALWDRTPCPPSPSRARRPAPPRRKSSPGAA